MEVKIMADVTSDLLAAVLAATPDRKSAALRVLRGEEPLRSYADF